LEAVLRGKQSIRTIGIIRPGGVFRRHSVGARCGHAPRVPGCGFLFVLRDFLRFIPL